MWQYSMIPGLSAADSTTAPEVIRPFRALTVVEVELDAVVNYR